MLEVELKFAVPPGEEAALQARLEGAGIAWQPPKIQQDRYFAHPARDFAATDEALRLRRDGNRNRITYKGPKLDAVSKTRREIELPLVDGDDFLDRFSELLAALGFVPRLTVVKARTSGTFVRAGRTVEVCVDRVEGLGTFLEIETQADAAERVAATELLLEISRSWGLTATERRSYLEMLLLAQGSSTGRA